MSALLSIVDLVAGYGPVTVLEGACLEVASSSRCALLLGGSQFK